MEIELQNIRELRLRHRRAISCVHSTRAETNLRSREKQKLLVLVLNDLKLTLESAKKSMAASAGDMLVLTTAGSFSVVSGMRYASFFSGDTSPFQNSLSSVAHEDDKSHDHSQVDCLVIALESDNLIDNFPIPLDTGVLHLGCRRETNRQTNVEQFRLLLRKFHTPARAREDAIMKASIDRQLELLLIESLSDFIFAPSSTIRPFNSPDSRIKAVVNDVIRNPGYAWTLDSMSAQANLSRSVFADRFKSVT